MICRLKRGLRWLRKANSYHMISRWRIPGAVEDVYALIANVTEYPQWWGDVFLQVEPATGVRSESSGTAADVRTTGLLPYRIRFHSQLCGGIPLQQITIRTGGDFVGRGTWRFRQDDGEVEVSFDWTLRVRKPLIRRLSFLLKPIFIVNHRWSMARGQRRLRELLGAKACLVPPRFTHIGPHAATGLP